MAHDVSQGSVGSAGFGLFVRYYVLASHKAEERTHLTMARKLGEQTERASSHYPLSGPSTQNLTNPARLYLLENLVSYSAVAGDCGWGLSLCYIDLWGDVKDLNQNDLTLQL